MSNAPVTPGQVLAGKYRVDRVLGVGGMGVVVQATRLHLEDRVALKFMLPEALANADVAGRFLREARLAVKLKSEHVAKVMDVGTLETGSPYIVMEYLDGTDLENLLGKQGPLPLSDVAEYVIQACDAIAEAHALGIVHRDLKPANLFLVRRPDGTPLIKVLDFGISKANSLTESAGSTTKASTMMGSPYYMSPEQMRSAKDVDARSDVWSMGVVIYQLLTGRLPFDADSLGGIMAQVLQDDPVAISTVRPDAPHAFEAIVRRCLKRDLNARAQNVGELAAALAPHAPERAKPIADRIVSLLGAGRTGTVAMRATTTARPPPPDGYPMGAPVTPVTPIDLAASSAPPAGGIGVVTAPALTSTAAPRSRSRSGVSVVMGAVIVGIALGGGAYLSVRSPHPTTASAPLETTAPVVAPGDSGAPPEATSTPASATSSAPAVAAVAIATATTVEPAASSVGPGTPQPDAATSASAAPVAAVVAMPTAVPAAPASAAASAIRVRLPGRAGGLGVSPIETGPMSRPSATVVPAATAPVGPKKDVLDERN